MKHAVNITLATGTPGTPGHKRITMTSDVDSMDLDNLMPLIEDAIDVFHAASADDPDPHTFQPSKN